ncbi:MAG: hypothetical protein OXI01_05825 [Albidovulum sp.]|nr:hypothetical protein [Albidovulum sp.]
MYHSNFVAVYFPMLALWEYAPPGRRIGSHFLISVLAYDPGAHA